MKLFTTKLMLTDNNLSRAQEEAILASPNAMRAFVRKFESGERLPDSTYLPLFRTPGTFLGAIHIEQSPDDEFKVIAHPMILGKDREVFIEATELTALWCLLNNLTPTTVVLDTPKYSYMHDLLDSLRFSFYVKDGWRVYTNEGKNWRPQTIQAYTAIY